MVTCLVWSAVLVVVVLLILVVVCSVAIGALPLWPPSAVALITFYLLTRPRVPRAVTLAIAGATALALVIDLPFGLPDYSLAMRDIGYTGAFGGVLTFNVVDLPRLLWLSLPFCLASGAAAGSSLAAMHRLRRRPPLGPESIKRVVEIDRSAPLEAATHDHDHDTRSRSV